MNIGEFSDFDGYSDRVGVGCCNVSVWNGVEVQPLQQAGRSIATDVALAALQKACFESDRVLAPMGGSISGAAEKDPDGNTTAEIEVTVSSDDGSFEVTATGSVNQDGNASGRVEATYNWQRD
jgi:hypothetical protein